MPIRRILNGETSPRHLDALAKIVVGMSAATTVLMVLVAVLGLPRILSTDAASTAVKRNGEVQACRAKFSAEVTTGSVDLQLVIVDGLAATARGDDAALAEIVEPGPNGEPSRYQQVTEQVASALVHYKQAIALSSDDPAEFLRQCRSN